MVIYILYTSNTKRTLNECYCMSQFGYRRLVWMNQNKTLNNHINGLNRRTFSLVYNDFSSSFLELLEKDKSVTIHFRNLQTLAYETLKVKIWVILLTELKISFLPYYSKRKYVSHKELSLSFKWNVCINQRVSVSNLQELFCFVTCDML